MAAYPKPSGNTGTFNNQSFTHPDTGGLTIDEAKAYFVTYPNTQSPSTIIANNFSTTGTLNVGGTSQFGGDATFIGGATITGPLIFSDNVEVDGTTTLNDTLLALSTAEIDGELTVNNNIILNVDPAFPAVKTYIQFSDLTVQDTAFVDANYAQKNESNTFISPYIQTFQGSNATGPTTAPLQFSNVTTSEYGSLYVDPGVNNDLTIYSNQVGGGLTVRNSTNSFTINPTTTNTATFLNPIATNSSITGSVFNVVAPSQDAYSLYINSVGGYGLVVANITTGGLGTLTLSNNGSTNTTLTSTASGLSINDTVFATQFNISNGSYFPSGINSGINNNSSNNAGQNPFFYFALNDTTNTQQIPFYLYYNALLLNATLNMNNNDINNVKNITGNSSSPITINSNITMGTGDNINMNSNSINNISSINANTGGSFTLGNQGSAQCTIAGGSFTAGNSLGINSTNGATVFNYYTANNLSLNMGTSDTLKIQNTGTSLMELSPTAGVNIYQNIGTNGFDINMLGGDIIGCNSITDVTGQFVTTNTPPDNSIPTAIATTGYVANNAPIYLQSSFTNVWAGTSSISPSTVNVITTRIASTNIVSFNNVNVIVNSNAGIGNTLIAQFQFNTNPWSTYPPASGAATSISVYCNTNGATYSCQTAWFASPATLWISYPPGAPTSPCQFTVNLSSFGAFAG